MLLTGEPSPSVSCGYRYVGQQVGAAAAAPRYRALTCSQSRCRIAIAPLEGMKHCPHAWGYLVRRQSRAWWRAGAVECGSLRVIRTGCGGIIGSVGFD